MPGAQNVPAADPNLPSMRQHLSAAYGRACGAFVARGWRYWGTALLTVILGVGLGRWMDDHQFGMNFRDWLYQRICALSPRTRTHSQHTVLVLLGDDEYWMGDLAARRPIKRDYLAKLITKLANAGAIVVGVDFQLRAQNQDGSLIEHKDYVRETELLAKAVREVPAYCTVVLPKTSAPGNDDDHYTQELSVYDKFNLGEHAVFGDINLDFDIRRIPPGDMLDNGESLPSFSVAVAGAVDKRAVQDAMRSGFEEFPYGVFLSPERFDALSANEVNNLSASQLSKSVFGKIVLIGGNWHTFSFKRGPRVDEHDSPVGALAGVFLHANYVEAILMGDTIRPVASFYLLLSELIVGTMVALILGLPKNPGKYIGLFVVALVIVTIVSMQNFGIFFEFSIPLLLVFLHYLYHIVNEWRCEAKLYREQLLRQTGKEH